MIIDFEDWHEMVRSKDLLVATTAVVSFNIVHRIVCFEDMHGRDIQMVGMSL